MEQIKKFRCLVVDDEVNVRKRIVCKIEQLSSIEVIGETGSPGEVLEMVAELRPDIIFLDIEMPGKDGFELLHEIREVNREAKVIFLTAFNQYAIKAIKNEAYDYLLKPLDLDELSQTLIRLSDSANISFEEKLNDIRFCSLSTREKEILEHLLHGRTSVEIAGILYISKNTVDTHRRNILSKLNIRSTIELLSVIN